MMCLIMPQGKHKSTLMAKFLINSLMSATPVQRKASVCVGILEPAILLS